MRKLLYSTPLIIIAILLLTNPSTKDFKDYLGKNTYAGLRRTSNFFVFSRYADNSFDEANDVNFKNTYIAYFGNFYPTHIETPKQVFTDWRDSISTDSSTHLPYPPAK